MSGHKKADLARRAIAYLARTDLALHWGFSEADPPSPEIRRLLMPYFADGEIEMTTSRLLQDYLVEQTAGGVSAEERAEPVGAPRLASPGVSCGLRRRRR